LSDGSNRIRDYCSWGSSDRVKHAEKQRQMVGTGAIPILSMMRQVIVMYVRKESDCHTGRPEQIRPIAVNGIIRVYKGTECGACQSEHSAQRQR